MKAMCNSPTTTAPREAVSPSGRAAGTFTIEMACTVCGEVQPLALVAYDAACRVVAVCERCATRPATLHAVASAVARHHA